MTDVVKGLTWLVEGFGSAKSAMITFGALLQSYFVVLLGSVVSTILLVIQKIYELESHLPILGGMFGILAQKVGATRDALNDQILKFAAMKFMAIDAAGKAVSAEDQKQAAIKNTGATVIAVTEQSSLYVKDKMAEEMKLRTQQAADLKKSQEEFAQSFITTQAEMFDFATQTSNTFFQGTGDAFADLIVDGKNFGESMKEVFRNMAKTVISYIIQIILKMLALYALEEVVTFGGSSVGAGAAAAAASAASSGFSGAMAEGGMINEPSVITGLRSGSRILAGEAGPEAVVPMGGNASGGSGGITINITGQFLEGNENAWNRLMREKVIPEIRRQTMFNPTGPFNRKRGVA
jgi:hypothetical protein